jgi:hypothetical protein
MKVRSEEDRFSDPLNSLTEQYHSTPETQTDESYNHPEDLEHFAHHEAIEREEARREAKYQGITVEEALAQHDPDAEPKKPKVTRVTPPEKQEPEIRYGGAKEESKNKAEWGSGDEGFKTPKTPAERLRKNVPYKVNYPLSNPQSVACRSLINRILGCSTSSSGPGETSDSIAPFILPGSYTSYDIYFFTTQTRTFRDVSNARDLVSNKLIYRPSNMSSIKPLSTAVQSTTPSLA